MNPSQDLTGGEEPFVPFTKAERMQQLADIDKSIVSLLPTVGRALQSITKTNATTDSENPQMATGDNDDDDDGDGKDVAVFKESMDQFVRTLRSVDVLIKRQVMGLEEVGTVNFSGGNSSSGGEPKSKALQPDGQGRIGGIEVGWLNSRSNKVERDMETEIWDELEVLMTGLVEGPNGGVTGEGEEQDTQMTS
ncbi:mediator complex- subunit Med11 [Apiospora arundinis]